MQRSCPWLNHKENICHGLIDYELNSLLNTLHLIDYISVHIRFDLERYLLNMKALTARIFTRRDNL